MTSEVPNKIGTNLEDLFPANEGAVESMSVSVTPKSIPTASAKLKGKTQKQVGKDDNAIAISINNFTNITNDTMMDLNKQQKHLMRRCPLHKTMC